MTEPLPYRGLYERVKSIIPAAPDALIRQEITYIMMDFSADTNMFVEEVPLNIQPNTLDYPFILQNGGRANRLMVVYDPNTITSGYYNWADGGISMRVPNIIRLARAPSEAKLWTAVIAKACGTPLMDTGTPPKPTGYPEVDAWIIDKYVDTLCYGVLWALQRLPAKPFRDPVGAKENDLLYNSGKSNARVNNMWANVYNAQAWRFPQAFRTISRKGWA